MPTHEAILGVLSCPGWWHLLLLTPSQAAAASSYPRWHRWVPATLYISANGPAVTSSLAETENRGLSAENAPKTGTHITAVWHHEPAASPATVAGWIGRRRKKMFPLVKITTVPQTIKKHKKTYKTQNSLRLQGIKHLLEADDMPLFMS